MAIFYARFLAGVRALVYLTAGSLGVTPARFFLYDLLGALISVPIVVSLGYLFGPQIELLIAYLGDLDHVVWLIVILSLIFYLSRVLVFTRNTGVNPT
jgi:membrane protein DedA with SNARE-associated domain